MMGWIWVRFYWDKRGNNFVDDSEVLNKFIYIFVHLISLLVRWKRLYGSVQSVRKSLDINPPTIGLSSSFASGFKGYWEILYNGLVE